MACATAALLMMTPKIQSRSRSRNMPGRTSSSTSSSHSHTTGTDRGLVEQARSSTQTPVVHNERGSFGSAPLTAKQKKQIDRAAAKEAKHREWHARQAREADEDIEAMAERTRKRQEKSSLKARQKQEKEEAKLQKQREKEQAKALQESVEGSKEAANRDSEMRRIAQRNCEVRKKHERKWMEKRRELLGDTPVGENEWELPTSDGTVRGAATGCKVRKKKFGEMLRRLLDKTEA